MLVSLFVFTFFVSFFFTEATFKREIETNLGPRCNLNNHLTICHWNLNSISAHDFTKLQLLQTACLAVNKFHIVCLSEIYFNSSISFDDDNLYISGYIVVRVDHPVNSKRGGKYIYYKNCLPLKVLYIRFLHENIAFELWIGDKICSFISLYWSPNQSYDVFVLFLDNLKLTLDTLAPKNPFSVVVFGDFNANSSNLYNNDITRDEGRKIEAVTLQNSLHQEEYEQPHALINSSLSNNLIFNSQINLLIYSGVHPSLHSHCHHQIFAKFKLDIVFPLPYEREIWHYRKANIDLTLYYVILFLMRGSYLITEILFE